MTHWSVSHTASYT